MYTPVIIELHDTNIYDIAEKFHDKPHFIFFDSRIDENDLGKFSFISFEPFLVLKSKGDTINVSSDKHSEILTGNLLDKIRDILAEYRIDKSLYADIAPLVGGAGMGYLSYEFGRQLEKLPCTAVDNLDLPECYFCFYDHIFIYDHTKDKIYISYLCIDNVKAEYIEKLMQRIQISSSIKDYEINNKATKTQKHDDNSKIVYELSKKDYISRFRQIKEYILSGDVYQVNFTHRFHVEMDKIDSWKLYKNLMRINPAPFACYLNFPEVCVASSSPERFLRVLGNHVETRPIKGTIGRGKTMTEDKDFMERLLSSIKDKAELAMIVDLMRNDIGKVCEIGSVKVDKYPEIETYASVHHLVATISGILSKNKDVIDLLKATFPGGSITGTPKIRAMELIDELEPTARGIYTGSIGYICFNGNMDTNIVIRTFVIKDGKAYFQAGGGIVVESDEEKEYQESLLKAEKLFMAI